MKLILMSKKRGRGLKMSKSRKVRKNAYVRVPETKGFKVNHKEVKAMSRTAFWSLLLIFNKFYTFFVVSIVDFVQVNAGLDKSQ